MSHHRDAEVGVRQVGDRILEAVALVADHKRRRLPIVEVPVVLRAPEMRGVDLHPLGFHASDLRRQVIAHDKRHTEHRAHRRTHHLRRVHIHAVAVHEDAIDPRRLCGTENRAHVARILQRVENQEEVARKLRVLLLPHHRQDTLTVFRVGHMLHQLARHLKDFRCPLRRTISRLADVR